MTWDTHPYAASGYLYILKPDILFQAQVNMPVIEYPLASLTYDNVTFGFLSNCRMGNTLLLGTTPGAWDLGRIYVRASLAQFGPIGDLTTINIGYCSRGRNIGELKVVDNSYITVLDLYEDWKRPSRMDSDGLVFKDYDWGIPGLTAPVAHVGATKGIGTMGFADPAIGALIIDTFDASTSYRTDALATPSSFVPLWQIKDGTFISGTYTSPAPVVSFPVGKRWIELWAEYPDVVGVSMPRHYLVVALDGEDDPNLIPTAHDGSWRLKPEGLSFQINISTRLDPADYIPGTVVLWLVKENRAGSEGSLSGYEIKFAGWLNHQASFSQANDKDTERSQTIFCIDDATRLSQLKALATTMQRRAIPANTNMLAGANLDRYWFWYLYWHTFAPMLSDIQWSDTGEDWCFMSFSSPGGSFYTVLDNLAKGIGWRTVSDALGRLKMKIDPMRLPKDQRNYVIKQSFLPDDINRLERVKNPFPTIGVMRATATVISNVDADAIITPFPDVYVVAPGDVEGQGLGESQNGYPWLVESSTNARERIGEDYDRVNADEGWLKLTPVHGGDSGIEPLDWIEVTTDADMIGWLDDPLDHEKCLVQQVDYVFDDDGETLKQVLIIERETNGAKGQADPIALGQTPKQAVFDFLGGSDGNYQPYDVMGSAYSVAQGWYSLDAGFGVAIYLNLPTAWKVDSMEVTYYKADGANPLGIIAATYLLTWSGGTTVFHESFPLNDVGGVGEKQFNPVFDGSSINGIYLVCSYSIGQLNSALRKVIVNYREG